MWDWLDSAATSVSNFFSGSSGATDTLSTVDAQGPGLDPNSVDGADAWGSSVNADGSITPQWTNPQGSLADGGQSVFGDVSPSFGSQVGSALSATAKTLGALGGIGSKGGGTNGYVTKTTELPGQNRAMGYETPNSPYPGKATTSVDPRQVNQYWYNLMKQFAYTGK